MKKRITFIFFILIQFIFFFFTPLAMTLDEDIFENTDEPVSSEGLSSEIEPPMPYPPEYPAEITEAIDLIRALEREIFLTNFLIELRERGYTHDEIQLVLKEEEEKMKEAALKEEIIEEAPEEEFSEEIVVTRLISVARPGEALPAEEKGLTAEFEKRDEIEKTKPAPLVRPREDEIYLQEELEKDRLTVLIEEGQAVLVPTVGLKRFMVTDTRVLKASKVDDKISITGMASGRSFLHVWDSEGLRSIRAVVRYRGYKRYLEAQKEAIKAEEMESFKVGYSFKRSRLNSKSVQAYRSYHRTQWAHGLKISGETPWGMVDSSLTYEGQETGGGAELERDLTFWDFNLKGSDLEIGLGNTGAYFSDLALPPSGFQGIRFGNPRRRNINYDLIWGTRSSRMWGYKISDWTTENYFSGARIEIKPADFIRFNTSYLRSLEDAEDVGEYLYSENIGLNFLDGVIRIDSEAARSKSEETDQHAHAYKVDATVNLKDYNLLLKGIYRDIEPNFKLTSGDTISHLGILGYHFDANYKPLKYLRLTGEYNIFRDRINFNPADTHIYNRDWRGTLEFNIWRNTTLRYTKARRNSEGESSPSHWRGETYQISHSLSLPVLKRYIGLNFSYAPNQYRNLSSPSSDYREKRYGMSMGLNVLKNLYYDLGYTLHHRHRLESGEFGAVKNLTTGLSLYPSQIFNTPFYGSLNLRCSKEYDVMENLPLSSEENVISGDAEITYRPSTDFRTYLRVGYNHIRGVLDPTRDRQETRIYGGGSYLLDTTLRWGAGGSVRGYIFEDLDANGKKDPYERGIPGIYVYAGEFYSTTTSPDGKFEFKRLKDPETLVMYDIKKLPEGYKPTSANSQKVELERGIVKEVNFGVIAAGEISGRIFNDVNMNGIFDEEDQGVIGILLKLDDGTMTQTTARGYYRMEDVKIGSRILTLDTITLPFNLLPLAGAERTLDVKAGKYYEEDFPLYALRTIVGNVFIDKNGNKKLDSGEEGAADVVLRCGDAAAITDNNGRYFLKNLPGHAQKIILDTETIPSGYRLSVEPSRTVVLSPSGEIREDVNFALEKK